jgi:uncharacterized membrane protein YvlD (DUF360 family)
VRASAALLKLLPRMLVTLVAAAAMLLLLAAILPGFDLAGAGAALGFAVVVGLINALLWPLIVRVALPLTVLTFGIGGLILNGLVTLLAAAVAPGVTLDGLGSAIVLWLALTAVATAFSALLALDDDARVLRPALKRAKKAGGRDPDAVPGVLFLEIDGLAHSVLRRALRDGNAPAMANWLREGTHRLHGWETDWSSQTGACQAGILHGSNEDMPAFRWWEKDRGAAIVTNHPRDAAELERRISDGRGLLHADGASRANILSGDAPHSLLTMSTVLNRDRPGRIGQDYFAYFSQPFNASRTLVRAVGDFLREIRAAVEQRRLDVQPRVHRGTVYAVMRAWATVVQLDLQVEAVIGDVQEGRTVVYSTFLAYDEVAHHSGLERPDTLATLRQVDRAVARIAAVAAAGPRPYEVVVLSDHGQTQGATFLQRYGETLEALVTRECDAEPAAVEASGSGSDEARGRLGAALTEASAAEGAGGATIRAATRGRRVDGAVLMEGEPESEGVPEIAVMASGCLGLISFPRLPGRVTREDIDERWPRLLPALREHPGIGFVLVRSREHGALVLGAHGEHRLDSGEVIGDDPLAPFGPRAARHVARTDGFAHCPDLMVNSTWWPDTEEVAAFEELVGSHGGLGGPQAHPFVLAPADWPWPEDGVVGAATLHHVLRGWLARLGHESYAEVVKA